jgi:hypothetical protein
MPKYNHYMCILQAILQSYLLVLYDVVVFNPTQRVGEFGEPGVETLRHTSSLDMHGTSCSKCGTLNKELSEKLTTHESTLGNTTHGDPPPPRKVTDDTDQLHSTLNAEDVRQTTLLQRNAAACGRNGPYKAPVEPDNLLPSLLLQSRLHFAILFPVVLSLPSDF